MSKAMACVIRGQWAAARMTRYPPKDTPRAAALSTPK